MQKIRNFIGSNYSEIFTIGVLLVVFIVLFHFFGHYLAHFTIDFGREVYFPQEILQGKILYKDIFNIFGPLSYQINAALYKVFGVSLDTLRLAGAFNSLIIVFLLYGLSRLFTSREVSWIAIIFIMVVCVFNPLIFNYIFPYTYAMTYALSALLFSILFLMLYLKTDKQFFVPLSWFFIGASISSKYDYVPYAIFLVLTTIFIKFYKKIETKYILYSIISFITIPVISFSILFLQGLTLGDFLAQIQILRKFSLAPSINHFYQHSAGIYFEKSNLIADLRCFAYASGSFIILFNFIYFSLKFIKNNSPILILIFATVFYGISPLITHFPFYMFSWLPLFTLFVFCTVSIQTIKDKTYSKNSIYLIFLLLVLITSIKSFFFLSLYAYGPFMLPLLLIADIVFIVEYLPQWFPVIDKKLLKETLFIIFFGITIICLQSINTYLKYFSAVKSPNGTVYSFLNNAIPAQKTINYIQENSKSDDNIWIIPEGIMINFLTNHLSNGIYYNIIPPYIETFGEEKIISDTKKNSPEYIIINNRDSADHGYRYLCEDYGFKICEYVKSAYTPVANFTSDTWGIDASKITIYKKERPY